MGDSRQKDVRRALNKTYGFNSSDDELAFLKNFIRSDKKQEPPKVYPAPQVPHDFNLRHRLERKSRFDDQLGSSLTKRHRNNNEEDEMSVYIKSVSKRGELLGEEPIQPDSVLDLVSAADREFLKTQAAKSTDKSQEVVKLVEKPAIVKSVENEEQKKEKRYEIYISFIKKDYKGNFWRHTLFLTL